MSEPTSLELLNLVRSHFGSVCLVAVACAAASAIEQKAPGDALQDGRRSRTAAYPEPTTAENRGQLFQL